MRCAVGPLALAAALLLSSCVSVISSSSEQVCAARGMELDGVDIRQGSAFTSGWRRQYITDISSVDVRCSKPHDPGAQCRIEAFARGFEPAAEFNAGVGRRNLFLALGYLLIVPGVYLYFHYDDERDRSLADEQRVVSEGLKECKAPGGAKATLSPAHSD